MIQAALILGSGQWWWLAAIVVAAAIVLAVVAYRHSGLESHEQRTAAFLRLGAVLLVAACLLDPLWSSPQVRPGENLFAILVDNSQSLTIRDPNETKTRGEQLRDRLSEESNPWQARLRQDFDVRQYRVESGLQVLSSSEGLTFTGTASQLARSLDDLRGRFRDRPLAGVLLMTDGIATDDLEKLDVTGLPPIYPVMIGKAAGHVDLGVARVAVTTTAFEDAPVTVRAEISQVGCKGERVTVELVDEANAVVETQEVVCGSDGADSQVQFRFRPTKPGMSFYRLRVRGTAIEPANESTAENNERAIVVDRGSGPYRILYVTGRPNWEYKFLRRAIADDDQVRMTALVRVARKEPKFQWRGRTGESANPLFRGFDRVNEETEQYDRPVIVRLETATPDEFREGFPRLAEELYPFHAVILDDVEAEFFTHDQQSLLEKFVADRGGALVMLGGAESFERGGYAGTPIGRVLPVFLTAGTTAEARDPQGYRWALTREGMLQPWARRSANEADELAAQQQLPAHRTLHRAQTIKPGAIRVADFVDSSRQSLPGLVVQRFGAGKTAAVLAGDMWRTQLQSADDPSGAISERDDLGKFWRQLLRWAIVDVPSRVEVRPQQDAESRGLTRVEIRLRDKEHQPQDNAAVKVKFTLPDGTTSEQVAEPSLQEAGYYEVLVANRTSGATRVSVEAKDSEGQEVGAAESGWVFAPMAEELRRIAPDEGALKRLAERTGGEMVSLTDLEDFARRVSQRPAPLVQQVARPAWQNPLVLVAILGCLCGEWGLRRWRGLA